MEHGRSEEEEEEEVEEIKEGEKSWALVSGRLLLTEQLKDLFRRVCVCIRCAH